MFRDKMIYTAAALGLMAAAPAARAGLTIDVRVHGASGAATKEVVAALGDVVNLDVYGVVSGANGSVADEAMQSFTGSFASTPTAGGAAIGNFSTFLAAFPFNAATTIGRPQDLNGLSGLDLGSGGTATDTTADYVFGRAGSIQTGNEFLLGTLSWTVTEVPGTGATSLNFLPRARNTAAIWNEDGTAKNPTTGTFQAGQAVAVAVPEPASAAVVGLGTLGLLSRRRSPRDALSRAG